MIVSTIVFVAVAVCVWQHVELHRCVEDQERRIDCLLNREKVLEEWVRNLPELIRSELLKSEKRQREIRDGDERDCDER